MITTISEHDFVNAFKDYNRADNFSREGLQELFNYYEELESDIGEPIELDVIAICCEWNEYSPEELLHQYQHLIDEGAEDEALETLEQELNDNTFIIKLSSSYLIMEF